MECLLYRNGDRAPIGAQTQKSVLTMSESDF